MFTKIGGARIFFDTVGSQLRIDGERMVERQSLIVMHGGPGFDHSTMRPFFDRFADTHHVVYIDHRGNGRSTGASKTWNLAQWGDDVKAICDAQGIVKPVVYGNSFGGMVAMAYAARHPGHPAKLILSSTAARMHFDATFAKMKELGGAKARKVAEKFWTAPGPQTMQDYMVVCMPLYNPGPHPDEVAARKRAIVRLEVARHFITGEMRTMDTRAGLARIACPTLVLAGALDPITPPVCAREVHAGIAKGLSELIVFEKAGHGVHRDDAKRAEKVLRKFLSAPVSK